MNILRSINQSTSEASTRLWPGKSPTLRTALLFASAVACGAAGWSGKSTLHFLCLQYPFVYMESRRRLDSFSAVLYYAGATWSVVPGTERFFRSQNLVFPSLIWIALVAVSATPWLAFFTRRALPLASSAALIVLSLPPFSLVTVAHPFISAGIWFPGTRWIGLGLPLLLTSLYRRLGVGFTLAMLAAASVIAHGRVRLPQPDHRILPVDTFFGGQPPRDLSGAALQTQETAIQQIALAHPDTLLLFPESIIPIWTPMHDKRWTSTFARLKVQHTGLLIGTTFPIPNSQANRNVLLSRGDTEHLSYVQRVPVPIGMWRITDQQHGFPLMLRFPAAIRIWNRRAGVLVCYEQLLVWPALQTLSRNPDFLLAPSNLYWAAGTIIPTIQHVCAQDWADLWGIPLYEATNR